MTEGLSAERWWWCGDDGKVLRVMVLEAGVTLGLNFRTKTKAPNISGQQMSASHKFGVGRASSEAASPRGACGSGGNTEEKSLGALCRIK